MDDRYIQFSVNNEVGGHFCALGRRNHSAELQSLIELHVGVADDVKGEVDVRLGSNAFGSGLQCRHKLVIQ